MGHRDFVYTNGQRAGQVLWIARTDQSEICQVVVCVNAAAESAAGLALITAVKTAGCQWREKVSFKVQSAGAHACLVDHSSKLIKQGDAAIVGNACCEILVWVVNTGTRWRGQEMLTRQQLSTGAQSQQGRRAASASAGSLDQPPADIDCFVSGVE